MNIFFSALPISPLVLLILMFIVVLLVWAIADFLKASNGNRAEDSPLWILLILLCPLVGALIHFTVGRNQAAYRRKFKPDFRRFDRHKK